MRIRSRAVRISFVFLFGFGLTGMIAAPCGRDHGREAGLDNQGSPGHTEGKWKIYRNERWGFCVAYPSGWSLLEGFDGAGMSATPPQQTGVTKGTRISAGALPNQLLGMTSGPPRTLEQNFEIDLRAHRESGDRDVQVLLERRISFSGLLALTTAMRWTDPTRGLRWFEETLWIMKKEAVYTVELRCPPAEMPRLEAIHEKMVKTLALDCQAAEPALDSRRSGSGGQVRWWTTYRNGNYSFSLRFPAQDWTLYVGEDGNGMRLTPKDATLFRLPPEIGAGGAVGQPNGKGKCCETLEEDFQSILEAMRQGPDPAQNLVVLSKKRTGPLGLPAIVSSVRYRNASGGVWLDNEILIHTRDDGTAYHLGLRCSPDDLPVLMPLFNKIVATFRIPGPRA
ncbi:MAG TPA: hypothetical protein VG028_08135 [Terriglobia bacterium]|nr:hypothetical protein [Terriglobia bacterium]